MNLLSVIFIARDDEFKASEKLSVVFVFSFVSKELPKTKERFLDLRVSSNAFVEMLLDIGLFFILLAI